MTGTRRLVLYCITLLSPLAFAPPAWALKIYRTGNLADAASSTQQTICLAGGGNDDEWASGWKELLNGSGGGDVVIIRADGRRGEYENWIYRDEGSHGFPNVNSVTTISIRNHADADRPEVEPLIRDAELVFFAGGDQSIYIDSFRDSRLLHAVEYVMNVKKIPISGTSAGMALLADIDFAAHYDSPSETGAIVTAEDVLRNPMGDFVDLNRTVLMAPFMDHVITDTHFSQRNRQARLMGFMARAAANHYYEDTAFSAIKGIGVDEGTAICYGSRGLARVHGAGDAFFLRAKAPIEKIQHGHALHWFGGGRAVSAYILSASTDGAWFDLQSWSGSGGRSEFWAVDGKNGTTPRFDRN